MSTIKSFEEIKAWQKARVLNKIIYKVTNNKELSNDIALKNQIRKSSISIISNIAEGFERDGNKEFIQFLSVAKASAGELHAQIYVAFDLNYISEPDFDTINKLIVEVSKMIGGLIIYLQGCNLKGNKFKEDLENYETKIYPPESEQLITKNK